MSSTPLVARAFAKLGFASPPKADLEGLGALYLAWCRNVPFDNVRKRIALARGGAEPLPGGLPEDFLAAYLEHGTGGTCWPSSNGLYSLVTAAGFDARRISASMFDRNDHNHGSILVRLGGRDWMVDSSIESDEPFPIVPGQAHEIASPVHPIRVEPHEKGTLVHWGQSQSTGTMPCRLMQDPVDQAFYLERYEISRGYSVFNTQLYARRNFPGKLVTYAARKRFEKTPSGVTSAELSLPELRESLVREMGYSPAIVAELEKTAGFE